MDNYNDYGTWEYEDNGVVKKILVNGNVRADNNFDIKNLALTGLGIAYLPKCLINAELKQGELVPILENLQMPEFSTYAVYKDNKFKTKKTQVFLEFISELLAEISADYR